MSKNIKYVLKTAFYFYINVITTVINPRHPFRVGKFSRALSEVNDEYNNNYLYLAEAETY